MNYSSDLKPDGSTDEFEIYHLEKDVLAELEVLRKNPFIKPMIPVAERGQCTTAGSLGLIIPGEGAGLAQSFSEPSVECWKISEVQFNFQE